MLHENLIRYQTTLVITNAIIAVGNHIVSQGSGGESKAFKKSMDDLRALLIPGEKDLQREKMKKILSLLKKEAAAGPFRVRSMDKPKKKGSFKRKR